MKAEISMEYEDVKDADVVAEAVSPDNFKTPPGFSIETMRKESRVITLLECGKIGSFIATIDDLLFCVATAERILRTMKRLDGTGPSRAHVR